MKTDALALALFLVIGAPFLNFLVALPLAIWKDWRRRQRRLGFRFLAQAVRREEQP